MKVKSIRATILPKHKGILTPDLCQVCKQGGPGIVTVRGTNGKFFSAHRWPCAVNNGLKVDTTYDDLQSN